MINVKELRVGNHVLVDGERKWVKSASYPWIFLDDDVPCHEDHLQPIPLTAELLTEIGFVKRTRYDNDKDYYIDAESAIQMERTRLVIPQIEIQNYSEIGNPELWEIKIISTDNDFAVEHKITVRYLHELEGFVYMTLHKELIKE